jgi:hypothetical protein
MRKCFSLFIIRFVGNDLAHFHEICYQLAWCLQQDYPRRNVEDAIEQGCAVV